MADGQFIGVYATGEAPRAMEAGGAGEGGGRLPAKRRRLWFVWSLASGRYRIQELNAICQPMTASRIISGQEFEARFEHEPSCAAMPEEEDSPHTGHTEQTAPAVPQRPALRADDPDLLRSWLLQDVPPPPENRDGFSPRQEAHITRLVEENRHSPLRAAASFRSAVDAAGDNTALPAADAERTLRADFVLALLTAKQGRLDECRGMLESIAAWDGVPFDGACELFSEFGLNLRRLGLTELALRFHSRALTFSSGDERVHFNLARAYHDLRSLEKARSHLEKALEIAPDFAAARQFLDFLTMPPPLSRPEEMSAHE